MIQRAVCERLTIPVFREALQNTRARCGGGGVRAFMTAEVYRRDGPGGGGLGTLSRDILQEAADQGLPIVFVTIAHDKIQRQKFDHSFWQHDDFVDADLASNPKLVKLDHQVHVLLQGKQINLTMWGTLMRGVNGTVPGIELSSADCGVQGFGRITERVYPGKHDDFATLGQEVILGMGGVRALRELDIPVELYHLNDGHNAFAAVQVLMDMGMRPEEFGAEQLKQLRDRMVYTSHTLVAAAADTFGPHSISGMIRDENTRRIIGMLGAYPHDGRLKDCSDPNVYNGHIDMVRMSMFLAGRINAVSRLNGHLLKENFPQFADRIVGGITNAVHPDWTAPSMAAVYDKYAVGWERRPEELARMEDRRDDPQFRKDFWGAHMAAKAALAEMVAGMEDEIASSGLDPRIFGGKLDPSLLTIGFARRVAGYKRHDLIVRDLARLIASINFGAGPIQLVFAGKAHPMDGDPGGGKEMLQTLLREGKELNEQYPDKVKFVFLPNYDVDKARVIIPGVDVWLNTPIWGLEASGTSTMDAILNGVPLMTTADGCVPEMMQFGDVGWAFGRIGSVDHEGNYSFDSRRLYLALRGASEVYYKSQDKLFLDKMISTVTQVLPYFMTPRLIEEYKRLMWKLA